MTNGNNGKFRLFVNNLKKICIAAWENCGTLTQVSGQCTARRGIKKEGPRAMREPSPELSSKNLVQLKKLRLCESGGFSASQLYVAARHIHAQSITRSSRCAIQILQIQGNGRSININAARLKISSCIGPNSLC